MLKDTFFNLPEDKRTVICHVAIIDVRMFAYLIASLNALVVEYHTEQKECRHERN